ncbi:hypothetical protein M378DRAFT_173208 [Amanita muscaria Koide BX008]|uniref:Uncharacterized protein n=1 Tax=Amanita muscaria (strain Koide BX008) TaxID=946122 RepID=A0A0C2WIC1_AMAMK|nr:hypothetical protein M378DRAFT_173208 [Amanita muscaria Koide BX008]
MLSISSWLVCSHRRKTTSTIRAILDRAPPPLEPRQPTAAGLVLQEVNDQRTIELFKYRLGPIPTELKMEYRRYCERASCSYNHLDFFYAPPPTWHIVVVTPVDPVGVNGNPQPLVDANPDSNVVDEAGLVDHGRRSTTATASRAAGAAKAVRYGSGEDP